RPNLQAAAGHEKFAHGARLRQRGRIRVRTNNQVDGARRPERDRQPTRHEGEVANDRVLNRSGSPVDEPIDGEKQQPQGDHDRRDVENRFATAAKSTRLDYVHDPSSPRSGARANRHTAAPLTRPHDSVDRQIDGAKGYARSSASKGKRKERESPE